MCLLLMIILKIILYIFLDFNIFFLFQSSYDQNRARDFKCPLCKEHMTSLKEFTTHLRGHNEAKPTNDPSDPTGIHFFSNLRGFY